MNRALPRLPADLATTAARLTPAERRTTFASTMAKLARDNPAQAEAITARTLRQLAAVQPQPLIKRALV